MKSRIALVTDSTADIPLDIREERHIHIAPLHILWGQDRFKDAVELTADAFFERLQKDPDLPTTSQPSPAEFAEVFQQARDDADADAVLALTISAELSGTYVSAQQAMQMVDFPVHLVDIRTASIATGLAVLKVADARDAGEPPEALLALAQSLATRTQLYFTVDTLEYLHKGGRIGGAKRLLGTALNIKPLLTVLDGKVEAAESIRTRKRALNRLVELYKEKLDPNKEAHVSLLHGHAPEVLDTLEEKFLAHHKPERLLKTQVGATIGVHVGPGAAGFALLQ